jgi:transcriptional regulator with XRE-family HTH domain
MISGRQMRAARSLLEWSGSDLAKKSGLTQMTISNIESDKVQPNEDSLQNILGAFDRHGVEFLPGEGVRLRQNETRVFSGKAGYRQFLDHVYETLKNGGRIRQFNLSDANNLHFADEYGQTHLERMEAIEGLDAKVLTMEGDHNFPASYCSYRWLGNDDTAIAPFYIYGDNLAMPMYESAHKRELLSVHSKILVERFIKEFDYFWGKASVPKKKNKAGNRSASI